MRIALVTMSFPWPNAPASGVYNLAQAKAFNTLQWQGRRVSCEAFVVTQGGFRSLESLIPKLKRFNQRPAKAELEGVVSHVVKGTFPRSPFLRWHVSPRSPRLAAWSVSRAVEAGLLRELEQYTPDALLIHDGLLMADMTHRLSKRLNVPFGIIEHDPIDFPKDSTLGRYYRRVVAPAKAVFSVGLPWYRHLRDSLELSQARLVVNGTMMATESQLAARRPERWSGKKIVFCVGSYIERKGHTLLIDAFAEAAISNAHLVIVGEPPEHIRAQVARLNITDRVEFLSNMSQSDVLQHMVWADVFALPSWWESFGLVYAEAMSAATPVIMSSDCGMSYHVRPGEHGWVLPPKDKPALVAALREAFDGRDLKAMGRAGRDLVRKKLTWQRNAELILAALSGQPDPDAHVPRAEKELEPQRFSR